MNWFNALILGLAQGLTEFLPISSSAHLAIMQHFMGLREPMVFFDVMLHLGTLFAIFVYFRKDIANMVLALAGRAPADAGSGFVWTGTQAEAWRYAAWLIVGTVPAGIAGVALNAVIHEAFSSIRIPATCLLVTGAFLFVAGRVREGEGKLQHSAWSVPLLIGLAQAAALMPGISRSGATICAALLLGVSRNAAARFSFFLAIIAIAGAAVLEGRDALGGGMPYPGLTLLGTGAAFISGLGALYLLIGILRRGRLGLFAYYCWALGAAVLIFSFVK
jgi:undecaprenyl-diphosphatase